jgi:hypothetical protein
VSLRDVGMLLRRHGEHGEHGERLHLRRRLRVHGDLPLRRRLRVRLRDGKGVVTR